MTRREKEILTDLIAAAKAAREVLEHYPITKGHPVSAELLKAITVAEKKGI